MTDLISRLASGERWDGDNAEVLRARGWTVLPGGVCKDPDGWAHADMPQPLDDIKDTLKLLPPGAVWHSFGGPDIPSAAALCIAILRTGESHD